MEDENQVGIRLAKLKKKVWYFKKMINNTKYEKSAPQLASTREHLTEAFERTYDPASALAWTREVLRQVEAARDDLDRVIESSGELPHMLEARRCAGNLVKKISNEIRKLERGE